MDKFHETVAECIARVDARIADVTRRFNAHAETLGSGTHEAFRNELAGLNALRQMFAAKMPTS